MFFSKLLPFYEKYGTKLMLILWGLFTLGFGVGTVLTPGENNTITCILVVSLCGWVAILIYYLCRKIFERKSPRCETETSESITSRISSPRIAKILDISFYLLLIALLLILQFVEDRPLGYYILITCLLGVLTLSILLIKSNRDVPYLVFKIIVFSALSSMAVFKRFYLAGMVDIGYFAALNHVTAEYGYLPSDLAGKQELCPLTHIITAITKILINGDIKLATIGAVVIPSILITIAIFVIVRHYFGNKYGLLAMLLVNISAYVIYFRYQANPSEWSWVYFVLLLLVLFLYVTSHGRNKIIFLVLTILSLLLIVLAHQFGSFIVLFLLAGIYLGSVLVKGKILTNMLFPFISYCVILFAVWLLSPFGFGLVKSVMMNGINHLLDSMSSSSSVVPTPSGVSSGSSAASVSSGISSGSLAASVSSGISSGSLAASVSADVSAGSSVASATSDVSLSPYVGVDAPSILDCMLSETPMVILYCTCLLLPLLLLLAANRKMIAGSAKTFLWYTCVTLIVGLGFFTAIWIFYTGMTIRIGMFLAIPFAIGLAGIFVFFSRLADTKKKRLVHCSIVLLLVCAIGFVNIAAPMINDDNVLWRKDYTITAEWSYADITSADTIVSHLPSSFGLFTDWMYTYPLWYQVYLNRYLDNRACSYLYGYPDGLLLWDPSEYKPGEFVLFREKMLHSPNNTVYRYGSNELSDMVMIGYINSSYQLTLENRGDKLYSIGSNSLYLII